MSWSNVKLILAREIRDQLRDRRTLFMIAVLPVLLYPLLGMSFLQIAQFTREQSTTVYVVGASDLTVDPPLIVNKQFAPALNSEDNEVGLMHLEFARVPTQPTSQSPEEVLEDTRQLVLSGQYDAALCFPPGFSERMERYRQANGTVSEDEGPSPEAGSTPTEAVDPNMPMPEIIHTMANERSAVASYRLHRVLDRWTKALGRANLAARGVPPAVAEPFVVKSVDLAEVVGNQGIATWAKILPVMLLLWALTGAFYPAIDLCAGEKERGTLETLLSSPAERSEIVMGKLVTIMLFSMATVILNLVSIGMTGWLVLAKMPKMGPPPWSSIGWLLLALIPIAALFSALCLALAAFAKSTKEGQYYLMPLLLITMPLAILPMAPGVELTFGNSLIPVTNVVLLLRATMEGNYADALRYVVPVVGVTLVCCLLAIRWAVDQFNQESVLFRESERLDLGLWFRHLIRDRKPTPSVGMALFCGALILVIRFFAGLTFPQPHDFPGFVQMALFSQAVVLLPVLGMTFLFTSRPARTLLLNWPSWRRVLTTVPAAVLLAILLHPAAIAFNNLLTQLYPVSKQVEEFGELMMKAPTLWQLVLLIAVPPAICEELAYRGFLLSGFRHLGRKWWAIGLSAAFFGFTHGILQQSIGACVVGLVVGFLAVQTGNLLPCMAFHLTHNGLLVALSGLIPTLLSKYPSLKNLVHTNSAGEFEGYSWLLVGMGLLLAAMLLTWFARLRYEKTDEEKLRDAIQRGTDAEDERLGGGIDDAISDAANRAFR